MIPSLVSVIVPTYNGGKYLAETIQCAVDQTYDKKEIIVVDDGSEEDIRPILDSFGNRIKWYRIKNSGPAAARNYGFRKSKGEYIAFLDHDDLWELNNLETCVDIMMSNPTCGLVYSYPKLIDHEGKVIPNERPSYFPSGYVFEEFLLKNRITSFSCALIRAKVFSELGCLDESKEVATCDDYDLWLRISTKYEVKFSTEPTVCYRIHPGNLVKDYDRNLCAHLHVLLRAVERAQREGLLTPARLSLVVKQHLFSKYQYFAYRYFYETREYEKARVLFRRLLSMNPRDLNVLKYYAFCCLPQELREGLRKWKQRIVSKEVMN